MFFIQEDLFKLFVCLKFQVTLRHHVKLSKNLDTVAIQHGTILNCVLSGSGHVFHKRRPIRPFV